MATISPAETALPTTPSHTPYRAREAEAGSPSKSLLSGPSETTATLTEALSGRSGEDFAIRSVGRQALAVGEELIPGDIPRVVIRNDDAPFALRHPA